MFWRTEKSTIVISLFKQLGQGNDDTKDGLNVCEVLLDPLIWLSKRRLSKYYIA